MMRTALVYFFVGVLGSVATGFSSDTSPIASLRGTQWAFVDGAGMHFGVRFLTEGEALVDAPIHETMKANWAQTGSRVVFAVIGGFENRIGSVSGKSMKGVVRMGVKPDDGPESTWMAALVEDVAPDTDRPPILYCAASLQIDRDMVKGVTIPPDEVLRIPVSFRITERGDVLEIATSTNMTARVTDYLREHIASWRYLPKISRGRPIACRVTTQVVVHLQPVSSKADAAKK